MTVLVARERSPRDRYRASAHAIAICVTAAFLANCARGVRQVNVPAAPSVTIDALWQQPTDLSTRNLFNGPGGETLRPRQQVFEFIARDTTGWSPGFDVRDGSGVEWSVKTGPEAQAEVVASRILWALGFHQPPTYYLDQWTLSGREAGPQSPGRFRPDVETLDAIGEWSWYENPFVGTRPFGGLIVANLMLNNWDWKSSNNRIYRLAASAGQVRHWFVVRDLGASFGRTTYPAILTWVKLRGFGQGTRNNLADFEQQGFIRSIQNDGRIDFDYRGMYRDLLGVVTLEDVRWTCQLMSQLSDEQWRDAFRAGGYDSAQTARFVAKIMNKIAQGLSLTSRTAGLP